MQRLLAALATLGSIVIGRLAQGDVCASTNSGLSAVTAIERLAGNDSVDLCIGTRPSDRALRREHDLIRVQEEHVPVRMFWKASSTLLASKAEVSMKDK